MKPALFLDRDGVVNVDHGYVHRVDQVVFVNGIFELVRLANLAGFAVVIVTNQAGIARGVYTEADFQGLSNWMNRRFSDAGARIDAVYHCPHHPTEGLGALKRECECRKPSPGMLKRAVRDLSLSLERSILVGDKGSDLQAGLSAGLGNLFLLRHPGREFSAIAPSHDAVAITTLLDPRLTGLLVAGPQQQAEAPPPACVSDASQAAPVSATDNTTP